MPLKYEVYGVRENHNDLRKLLGEIAERGERVISVTSQEAVSNGIHVEPRFTIVTEIETDA